MEHVIDKKQFSAELQGRFNLTEYRLRSSPLDLVIEELEALADNKELPPALAAQFRDWADRLNPALQTLNAVEQEFLDAFVEEKTL